MTRDEEIQKIGKLIQKKLDRLKELNCSLDTSWHQTGIFDNSIDVEMKQGNEQLVFELNTAG